MRDLVFKFIRTTVDGEVFENDAKKILWTENISTVFRAKSSFSNLSELVSTADRAPYELQSNHTSMK